jgi:hypothetical protein
MRAKRIRPACASASAIRSSVDGKSVDETCSIMSGCAASFMASNSRCGVLRAPSSHVAVLQSKGPMASLAFWRSGIGSTGRPAVNPARLGRKGDRGTQARHQRLLARLRSTAMRAGSVNPVVAANFDRFGCRPCENAEARGRRNIDFASNCFAAGILSRLEKAVMGDELCLGLLRAHDRHAADPRDFAEADIRERPLLGRMGG